MKIRLLVAPVILLVSAGVLVSQEGAQAPGQTPQQTPGQIDISVLQVPLMVSVTDNKGKLITNLTRNDFKVYEDGKVQSLKSFSRESDLPLSVGLLMDSSGSVIDKLKFEQAAATDFFFNTIKRRKDRATVIGFDSEVRILSDKSPDGFSDEPEALADAVRRVKAGGGTAVYDAVYKTVYKLMSKEDGDRRKLLIVISDGDDTASEYSLTEALEMAQRHDVAIYAVSTNRTSDTKRSEQVRGDDVLQRMVDETGGKAYFPLKLDDLASEFEKIGTELRSQYVLSYNPVNQNLDGTYRKVRVEMADKKHNARTRQGYFATQAGN